MENKNKERKNIFFTLNVFRNKKSVLWLFKQRELTCPKVSPAVLIVDRPFSQWSTTDSRGSLTPLTQWKSHECTPEDWNSFFFILFLCRFIFIIFVFIWHAWALPVPICIFFVDLDNRYFKERDRSDLKGFSCGAPPRYLQTGPIRSFRCFCYV